MLRREVRAIRARGCSSHCWAGADGEPFRLTSEENYSSWIADALSWRNGVLVMPQFSLLEGGAGQMLEKIPDVLKQLRSSQNLMCPQTRCSVKAASIRGSRDSAESWLARRIDEVYRELSREPVDEAMEEWGEGGQACLRHHEDGSFGLLISERRGAAASGHGVAFQNLSDGGKDVCGLALLLILGTVGTVGFQDKLPHFVMLDEPDARLDKRHAKALWRLLSGPQGPQQCLLTSLDNHSAFSDAAVKLLHEPADGQAT